MSYVPMHELFPEIAMEETRTITVLPNNEFGVLPGEYGLVEMYCDDEDCDCRRVFITVMSSVVKDSVAVVTFGWKNIDFYAKWFSSGMVLKYSDMDALSQKIVRDMHGIHLNEFSEQSKIAPAVMRMVTECALRDKTYVDRLKRHYKMFRAKVDEKYRNQ